MNGNEARKSDHWAVALVHGIGNTDRLKMIQEVCEAIQHARLHRAAIVLLVLDLEIERSL